MKIDLTAIVGEAGDQFAVGWQPVKITGIDVILTKASKESGYTSPNEAYAKGGGIGFVVECEVAESKRKNVSQSVTIYTSQSNTFGQANIRKLFRAMGYEDGGMPSDTDECIGKVIAIRFNLDENPQFGDKVVFAGAMSYESFVAWKQKQGPASEAMDHGPATDDDIPF